MMYLNHFVTARPEPAGIVVPSTGWIQEHYEFLTTEKKILTLLSCQVPTKLGMGKITKAISTHQRKVAMVIRVL